MLNDTSGLILRKTFFLDILRGLAALYVLIGHARWLLWEGYTEGYKLHPAEYGLFDTIQVYVLNLFAFGHQAVMLFFVLSGFVIQYSSYNQTVKSGTFSIRVYLIKRIRRIYPPFLFALLLTFVLDTIGKQSGYTIYSGTTNFVILNKSIFSDLSTQTLFGNIGMLQTLVTPVWGSNGPLWSLMYEWWFYVLYIPVFFINKRNPLVTAYLIGMLFLASLFLSVEHYRWVTVANYFFIWYLGVIAADWYMGRIGNQKTKTALVIYLLLVFITASYLVGFAHMTDYYTAAFFIVLIYVSIQSYRYLEGFRMLQPLSDFSYTLYVIHMPVLVLLSGWLQHRFSGALPMHLAYVYSGIFICLLIAWLCHFIVEVPFIKRSKH